MFRVIVIWRIEVCPCALDMAYVEAHFVNCLKIIVVQLCFFKMSFLDGPSNYLATVISCYKYVCCIHCVCTTLMVQVIMATVISCYTCCNCCVVLNFQLDANLVCPNCIFDAWGRVFVVWPDRLTLSLSHQNDGNCDEFYTATVGLWEIGRADACPKCIFNAWGCWAIL